MKFESPNKRFYADTGRKNNRASTPLARFFLSKLGSGFDSASTDGQPFRVIG